MRFLVPYDLLPRDVYEFLHESCGGMYERVDCTREELKEFGCGREVNYECCARAFVCNKCKDRLAMTAPAPEME
jgi:hypothetical protein